MKSKTFKGPLKLARVAVDDFILDNDDVRDTLRAIIISDDGITIKWVGANAMNRGTYPTITDARRIGKQHGLQMVAILAVDHGVGYSITTWGKCESTCRGVAAWAESSAGLQAIEGMAGATPSAGVVDCALDPDADKIDAALDLLGEIRAIVVGCGTKPGNAAAAIAKIRLVMDDANDKYKKGL